MKIFSNPAPQSTERVVQLVGKADAVAAGIKEVLDLIRQVCIIFYDVTRYTIFCTHSNFFYKTLTHELFELFKSIVYNVQFQVPIKGGIQNYDPHNYDDFYADEYGGFGSGQGSGGPRGSGPRGPPRGPPRGMPPMGGGPSGRGPGPRGPGGMGGRGGLGPRNAFNDFGGHGPRANFSGPPRGNFGGGGGNFGGGNFGGNRGGGGGNSGGGNFGNNGGGGNQSETTTQVTIPKDVSVLILVIYKK